MADTTQSAERSAAIDTLIDWRKAWREGEEARKQYEEAQRKLAMMQTTEQTK